MPDAALALAFLWGSIFLPPGHCLLLPTADQGASDAGAPIWNLRIDPAKRTLTWDLWSNITDVQCVRGLGATRRATGRRRCSYPFLPRCQPTNFTVRTTGHPHFSASILYPQPGGLRGAAAEHLQCWVHDVDRVSCSWDVGPAAPRDVQYELQWEDLQTRDVRTCEAPVRDARGVHVGCAFRDVSSTSQQLQRFWVTGRSREGPVPCTEVLLALPEMERLSARNLSGACRGGRAELRWDAHSLLHSGFQYQLRTRQGSEAPQTVTTWENHMTVPHAGDLVVEIRVQSLDYGHWGPWGAPRSFSCSPQTRAVWIPALLAALTALLLATAGLFLWYRTSLTQKLFPPIPKLRDPFSDQLPCGQLVTVAEQQECPVVAVEILGEP